MTVVNCWLTIPTSPSSPTKPTSVPTEPPPSGGTAASASIPSPAVINSSYFCANAAPLRRAPDHQNRQRPTHRTVPHRDQPCPFLLGPVHAALCQAHRTY